MNKNTLQLLIVINLQDKEKTWCKDKENRLIDKSDISNIVTNSYLNKKLPTLATKAELKEEQDKIAQL